MSDADGVCLFHLGGVRVCDAVPYFKKRAFFGIRVPRCDTLTVSLPDCGYFHFGNSRVLPQNKSAALLRRLTRRGYQKRWRGELSTAR